MSNSENDSSAPGTDSVVIVGCGTMGCDIAAIFLASGWGVKAGVTGADNIKKRRAAIESSLHDLKAENEPSKLTFFDDLERLDWAGVAIVIESVPEIFEVKKMVFLQMDKFVPAGVPIGSNTSGFRISEIAKDCLSASRMLGLHFFLPAHLVPAVEVVRGEQTSSNIAERVSSIMSEVGSVPINVAKDNPGFLANRIQHALMREAFHMIDEGLGTAEDIDAAVRYGFGFRYVAAGPIMQKEFAGLDTQHMAASAIYPSLCNDKVPSKALTERVENGCFGVKARQGFRSWTDEEIELEQASYRSKLLRALEILRS